MKKLLTITGMIMGLSFWAAAQPGFTLLDSMDGTTAYYTDLQMVNPSFIAGLRYGGNTQSVDLRTNTGNSFGTLVRSIPIGDTLSYFTALEVAGNHIYAVGSSLQAIDITNAATPLTGNKISVSYTESAGHWGDMLYLLSQQATNNKLSIYSVANPLSPQLIDSVFLPNYGTFKISRNKLYYVQSDTGTGNRIHTYTLAGTAPYLTLTRTLTINPRSPVDMPLADIAGDHLFVKTIDTAYDFRILLNGDLQPVGKNATVFNGFRMCAVDTGILCYLSYHQLLGQSVNTGAARLVDTTDRFTFNTFRYMGRLGSNVYYADYRTFKLVSLKNAGVGVPVTPGQDDRFRIYPNPAKEQWTIDSRADGQFVLYSAEGKVLENRRLAAGSRITVSAGSLSPAIYYYSIIARDGSRSPGTLIKN